MSISLRVSGTFDLADDFFQFVAKFGFQKTDPQNIAQTQGFIYGNITYDNKGTSSGVVSNQILGGPGQKSMTPCQGNTFLFRSSQQLSLLCLVP